MEQKFVGQVIGVTGDSPHYDEAINRIVLLEGGVLGGSIGHDDSWQMNQIIVIGRDDFSEEYLLESINVCQRRRFTFNYMSQEVFWDLWLWDEQQPYYEGDPRIDEHPGLSFLASVGFNWPTIRELQGMSSIDDTRNWNSESILKSRFGYHVRKGFSEKTRRKRLNNAITASEGLGLKEVANLIVFFIHLGQGKADGSMEGAITRWKSDLNWLYETHYLNSEHRFKWP